MLRKICSKKTLCSLLTILIIVALVVSSIYFLPANQRSESTSQDIPSVSDVPEIIYSNSSTSSQGVKEVTNSPVEGLKIDKNNKYIPEKDKNIKAGNNTLILFVKYTDEKSVRDSLDKLGLTLVRLLQSDGTVIAKNTNNISAKKINELAAKDENILYIMDDGIRMKRSVTNTSELSPSPYVPNDMYYNELWHLNNINGISVSKAWETTKGSDDILVAVIDSGIVSAHEEFKGRIYKQYDIPDDDGSAEDNAEFSHGSHVAGIIAANADNNIGICGIASGVKLLVIDTFYYDELEEEEYATDSDIFTAYELCINEKANVANMSFGGFTNDIDYFSRRIYNTKLSNLRKNNIISVAAAGNESTSDQVLPSDSEYVISVIATNEDDEKCDFSNYGSDKDISAPGENILSIANSRDYAYADGTSMAAPVVSGVVALLLSYKKDLSPSQIESILYSTATRLGKATETTKDASFGYGRINAAAAMEKLISLFPSASPTVVPTPTLELETTSIPTFTSTLEPIQTSNPTIVPAEKTASTPRSTPKVSSTPTFSNTPEISKKPEPSTTPEINESPKNSATPKIIKETLRFNKSKLTIKLGKKKMSRIRTNITKIEWKVVQKKKIIRIVKKYKKKVLIKGRRVGKAKLYAISKLTGKRKKCIIKVRR